MTRTNIGWGELEALRPQREGLRLSYGDESPLQFGILRVPPGSGPHPVAALIHGGCWEAEYDHRHVEPAAERLNARGMATWVVEYRRIGHPGGGWPGTFEDVAAGANHLAVIADAHHLDLGRVVLVGHSAGGHLALWAARWRSRRGSPPAVRGVVALAAITDLAGYARGGGSCNAATPALMGGSPEDLPERYARASPLEMVPLGIPLTLVHGAADTIVPPDHSTGLAAAESAAGGLARLVMIPGAGHFDLVATFADAWSRVEGEIQAALG